VRHKDSKFLIRTPLQPSETFQTKENPQKQCENF